MYSKDEISENIVRFVESLQNFINEQYATKYKNLTPPILSIDWGRKYARIVRNHNAQQSVHCFVDIRNGDILKAASWAGPAKYARGSIFDSNFGVGKAVNIYGAAYL